MVRRKLYINGNDTLTKQAVRLGGRHNMPPPRDLTFDLEVGVGVACDLGYPVTNGGVKSAQTPPCDILFFSVCLESPENQVTQTPFRIKRKI